MKKTVAFGRTRTDNPKLGETLTWACKCLSANSRLVVRDANHYPVSRRGRYRSDKRKSVRLQLQHHNTKSPNDGWERQSRTHENA